MILYIYLLFSLPNSFVKNKHLSYLDDYQLRVKTNIFDISKQLNRPKLLSGVQRI